MAAALLKISGGTVYDPAHGVDGEVRDLWIDGGKIVAAPADPAVRPARTLDAAGPGRDARRHRHALPHRRSEDEHGPADAARRKSHGRAGAAARRTRTAARWGACRSTFATGYRYAGLGYTTAFDAAIPPLSARHAHAELADTPCIDKGFYVLVGNNHYLLDAIGEQEPERVEAFLGWLLSAAKGYAPKLVNPGGVEAWKQRRRQRRTRSTTRAAVQRHAAADHPRRWPGPADELKLPHAVHVHTATIWACPATGRRRWKRCRAVEAVRGHLTHIQFHSYGGGGGTRTLSARGGAAGRVRQRASERLTVDVGQVMFGKTTSMTGDSQVGYYLSNLYQTQMVSQRHRAGNRLRHHADRIQEQEPGQRLAMGDRPGVVSAR